MKIPLDVIFSHIAPYAIHSFEDALNWMQTCKAGLKAANTMNKFWEPFLREVMANRLAWMQYVGFDDMAMLLKRNYVLWPKQMMDISKKTTGLLAVVKSKRVFDSRDMPHSIKGSTIGACGQLFMQAMTEVMLDAHGSLVATVKYDSHFNSIEEINELDAVFRFTKVSSLGKIEMTGTRSSLSHQWHRVGSCSIMCSGLEFTGEFRHDSHPERRLSKHTARRFSKDDASVGRGKLLVNGKYYENVKTQNVDEDDDKASAGMLFFVNDIQYKLDFKTGQIEIEKQK